jgi:TRAP-type C4-dicarboxylate transport system permease small subunit
VAMGNYFNKIRRVNDVIEAIELNFLFFIGFCLIIFMTLGVITRYVLHVSLFGTEAIPVLILVWASMIGASIGINKGSHFKLLIIIDLMPSSINTIIRVFVNSLITLFLIIVLVKSVELTAVVYIQKSFGLGISVAYVYLAIPIGVALMLIHVTFAILNDILNLKRGV